MCSQRDYSQRDLFNFFKKFLQKPLKPRSANTQQGLMKASTNLFS